MLSRAVITRSGRFLVRCNKSQVRHNSSSGSQQSYAIKWTTPLILGLAGGAALTWTIQNPRSKPTYSDKGTSTSTLTSATHQEASTSPLHQSPIPNHDTSPENLRAAEAEFTSLLGASNISSVPAELLSRSSTAWSPSPTSRTADLILYPSSTAEVSAIMKICFARNIPVTPFSGGTSLDGALAATRGGVVVDFRRMDRVLEVHWDDLDVVVQPAVGWEDLNGMLREKGLFFPPDPGPGAQIGGMIATGCSGTNAYRYGPMKDWVISTALVLADGTIVKTRQRPRKSSAGYDLTRLMVGSSGTLGLVTEATLKLTALPTNVHVAVVAFPTSKDAVNTVVRMIQQGLQIEALELLDANTMKASNDSGFTDVQYTEAPTLFMKFAGTESETVARQVVLARKLAEQHNSASFESSADPDKIEGLWSARKTALWNLIAQKKHPDDLFMSSDVAVPISAMAGIIEESHEKFKEAGLLGSTLGHVGDGNFHASVVYSEAEKEKAERIILEIRRRGIELEGTVTGEHGVGLTLRDLVTEELGAEATDMMRKIKLALDPKCILACDKVVRMEAGDDH